MSGSEQKHSYDYYIDNLGNWFCEGNPVTDPRVFRMLSRSLFQEGNDFFIRCEGEVHPVRVADAPLWIRYVHLQVDSSGNLLEVEIELYDGRREPLDADTLVVAEYQALYCLSTPRRLQTRFGKIAYYELTRFLQMDEQAQSFFFVIAGRRCDIRHES